MKIFATEFRVGDKIYEGPYIYAKSFEEAEMEAVVFGVVVVVGILQAVISDEGEDTEWNRVLH